MRDVDDTSKRFEVSGSDAAEVPETSLWDWLGDRAEVHGDQHHPFAVHDGEGWSDTSWADFLADVRSLGSALVAHGVQRGEHVVVMANTSYGWTRSDFAITAIGAVAVPVYVSSSEAQRSSALEKIESRFAFAGDSEQAERLRETQPDLTIWTFDDVDSLSGEITREDLAAFDERASEVDRDMLATIVFTSGTTGTPKGVLLTHHQLMWTARQTAGHLGEALDPGESTLLFLPLGHIFARTVVLAALESGVQLAFGRSMDDVPSDLRSYRPTFLLAVPRVLDRVISGAREQADGWRRPVFDWAVHIARRCSKQERPGLVTRLSYALADRLVLSRLRAGIGDRVEYAVSGGARLSPKLAHTVEGAGISVLEGYGLTETTGPCCANTPRSNRIGTVGTPLPGIDIRISDDEEILVRGLAVTDGYLHQGSPLTDDGWFPTGDRGSITDDGHVVVHSRIKEIIVTDGGESIAPEPLEDILTEDPLIAQAMVIGNDRPFVAALIAVDEARAPADERQCREQVQRAIDRANETVSERQSIREFEIIERQFSQEHQEVTPTLKLRRQEILDHFADRVDHIYGEDSDV